MAYLVVYGCCALDWCSIAHVTALRHIGGELHPGERACQEEDARDEESLDPVLRQRHELLTEATGQVTNQENYGPITTVTSRSKYAAATNNPGS